ncbi:MAG: DegT/DnrJ/EryC1/StrS family aminotransferase, partial [Planctomycetes bacterium]|nr:DegT/DnrJ/EryC1/StrS family aminotransferase [Planctomycetota bacterium]
RKNVPVWADVREDDFLLDPDSVEERISPRTRAIWVTHLWGFPAEVDRLRQIADEHEIYLLEDCAHALFTTYKGKYLGKWGHFGTFSFNMGKQLPTGEGGMAITDDDELAAELNKRIIFGESPEVLSSNYRMTEFQAAVGVEQLKKVPGYLEKYRDGRKSLDAAVEDCEWLDARTALPDSEVSPYFWSCIFRGERAGISNGVFRAALGEVCSGEFGMGFTQRPAYFYEFFRAPNAYANTGCPYNCAHYDGTVEWKAGLCPVAEDVLPRLVTTNNMVEVEEARRKADLLRDAIQVAESVDVEETEYSELEQIVLEVVKERGPIEPGEAIDTLAEHGYEASEHRVLGVMEGLRDRYPYKLSHAGPRRFAYHDLSESG